MPDESEKLPTDTGDVDDTTYQTVAEAYYTKKIAAPTAARLNSQNAYTIAAAVAAAVITAGAFAGLETEPLGVRIVGTLALLAWMVTAALFMRAVAAPYLRVESEPDKVFSRRAFVEAALANAKNEDATINGRQRQARWLAGIASLLTVTAVGLAIFLPSSSATENVTVRLDKADQESLSELCRQRMPTVVSGTTDPDSLDDGTIRFDPDPEECKTPGATTLQEKKTVYILEP